MGRVIVKLYMQSFLSSDGEIEGGEDFNITKSRNTNNYFSLHISSKTNKFKNKVSLNMHHLNCKIAYIIFSVKKKSSICEEKLELRILKAHCID